jgi:hypothetical protein
MKEQQFEGVDYNFRPRSYWDTSEPLQASLAKRRTVFMPEFAEGEVEIARIEQRTTIGEVISTRSRKYGEMIAYSIVDDFDDPEPYNVAPKTSKKPLTLGELIRLIDGGRSDEADWAPNESLAIYFTVGSYRDGEQSLNHLDHSRDLSRVESVFYPQLNLHYEKVLDRWYQEEKAKLI